MATQGKGYSYVDLNDLVRQNYSTESEDGVNKQINMELSAMYTYLSMVKLSFCLHFKVSFLFNNCRPIILTELM